MANIKYVCKVIWYIIVDRTKYLVDFILLLLLLPVIFVMVGVFAIYACIEWVRLWIARTFKQSEQRI